MRPGASLPLIAIASPRACRHSFRPAFASPLLRISSCSNSAQARRDDGVLVEKEREKKEKRRKEEKQQGLHGNWCDCEGSIAKAASRPNAGNVKQKCYLLLEGRGTPRTGLLIPRRPTHPPTHPNLRPATGKGFGRRQIHHRLRASSIK
jgi:hypothetical protein